MLILYGTSCCHLCEQAEALVARVAPMCGAEWVMTDIALDDGLCERFGARIPVLARDGRTLDWPFSLLDVRRFIMEEEEYS